jgi:hypothetical protein
LLWSINLLPQVISETIVNLWSRIFVIWM